MFKKSRKILSITIILILFISTCGCQTQESSFDIANANETVKTENSETENIESENIEIENIEREHITEENYIKELIEEENKIRELLIEEESIEEVLLCNSIYISQDHIDEFSKNSQISKLFGDKVKLTPVLKKIAIGTGVIVTLVVLKKIGLPKPVASIVVKALDKSITFAKGGAVIGSLYGGITGATDEIDSSGRSSAVIGVATAIVGLIITSVSLINVIPSSGLTGITAEAGIDLIIAGISLSAASIGTLSAAHNAVKTFTSTDSSDINWDNIDWNQVGVSSVEKAIDNGADGYMWGAISGAIIGGAEGFASFKKGFAPYSSKEMRINQTPKNSAYAHWDGKRGNSNYVIDKTIKIRGEKPIKKGTKIRYKNGVPDFSQSAKAQVDIPTMTNNRTKNFKQADEALAKIFTTKKYKGKKWSARDVEKYRKKQHLTWHEENNMKSMQLVPRQINQFFTHLGGVGEYNAMLGESRVTKFD